MRKSMVEGNSLKLILQFAIPLLLGNLFQQTYNVADAAIVGQTLGPGIRILYWHNGRLCGAYCPTFWRK